MICETNQLASNEPNEDELFVTRSKVSDGDVLVGVVDGHGGKGKSRNSVFVFLPGIPGISPSSVYCPLFSKFILSFRGVNHFNI